MITFKQLQKMERRVLAQECYTAKESWESAKEEDKKDYVRWLQKQCGEMFCSIHVGI